MSNEIAIVCTLNEVEFREREQNVLQKIKASVIEANETENGYSFRFPSDDNSVAMLNEFIVLERRCCTLLDFRLTVPRGLGDITLELSGTDGTKEFIAANFAKIKYGDRQVSFQRQFCVARIGPLAIYR